MLFRNSQRPQAAHLYELVMREVEEPLFKVVMGHVHATRVAQPPFSHQSRHLAQEAQEFGINE